MSSNLAFRNYPALYVSKVGGRSEFDRAAPISVLKWSGSIPHEEGAVDFPPPAASGQAKAHLPDLSVWLPSAVTAICDTLAGRRDLSLLRRWVDPSLYNRLAARLQSSPPSCLSSLPASIRSTRLQQVTEGVFEGAVAIADFGRIRAVAIRVEQFRGRWRITALETG